MGRGSRQSSRATLALDALIDQPVDHAMRRPPWTIRHPLHLRDYEPQDASPEIRTFLEECEQVMEASNIRRHFADSQHWKQSSFVFEGQSRAMEARISAERAQRLVASDVDLSDRLRALAEYPDRGYVFPKRTPEQMIIAIIADHHTERYLDRCEQEYAAQAVQAAHGDEEDRPHLHEALVGLLRQRTGSHGPFELLSYWPRGTNDSLRLLACDGRVIASAGGGWPRQLQLLGGKRALPGRRGQAVTALKALAAQVGWCVSHDPLTAAQRHLQRQKATS